MQMLIKSLFLQKTSQIGTPDILNSRFLEEHKKSFEIKFLVLTHSSILEQSEKNFQFKNWEKILRFD